jgi:hypothetical protein
MIKKAVALGLKERILASSDLYWLDDQEFYARTREHRFPPFSLIPRVAERRLYKQVASVPFAPENPFHRSLRHLDVRMEIEAQLAREAARVSGTRLADHGVIIDIPEPIKFEIDVPVLYPQEGRTAPYLESASVFSPEIVRGFGATLRRVALFAEVDPDVQRALEKMEPLRILRQGL